MAIDDQAAPAAARVRRASLADVGRVAALFAAYREFYGQPYDLAAGEAFLRARMGAGESVVLIAEAGDTAIGFAQIYPTFGSLELAPAWRLNDLFVRESSRGTGVGALLMAATETAAHAAGASWIDLETARDNAVAQRLYERAGYQRDEVFLHFVKDLAAPEQGTTSEAPQQRHDVGDRRHQADAGGEQQRVL